MIFDEKKFRKVSHLLVRESKPTDQYVNGSYIPSGVLVPVLKKHCPSVEVGGLDLFDPTPAKVVRLSRHLRSDYAASGYAVKPRFSIIYNGLRLDGYIAETLYLMVNGEVWSHTIYHQYSPEFLTSIDKYRSTSYKNRYNLG